MITFDEKGHVQPYEVVEMEMGEFERVFVENMEEREYRKQMFSNFLKFINDFKNELGISFFFWADGSFTTTKPLPMDIDIVCFIDYDHFTRKIRILDKYYSIGKSKFDVDIHFASTCKWNHRFYKRTIEDEKYWKGVFGSTRPDDDGITNPKGIIKINL